jgi:catechol 2,3-dioxygenase-like lactoylglutathione lyase family enzyme
MKHFLKTGLTPAGFLIFITFSCFNAHAQINKVEAIGITVSDMDRSVKFYHEVLGFNKISDNEFYGASFEQLQGIFGLRMRVVTMRLGDEKIELTDYLTSGGRRIPENAASNDLIFQHIAIVVSDMDKAYAQLRKYKVAHVSTAPQTIPQSNKAAAGVKAFYFRDPDMHNLELIYFPRGKGQLKWHQVTGKLFLGIDHTAISIRSTVSSLHFYEHLLGIMRKGESWNMGVEQARLNFVEGANLHITALRSPEGPGIEFLQYLVPGPGKPYPTDTKADDLWYWQNILITTNAPALYQVLKQAGYTFISKGLVRLETAKGTVEAFIVKDDDGHAILIKGAIEDK